MLPLLPGSGLSDPCRTTTKPGLAEAATRLSHPFHDPRHGAYNMKDFIELRRILTIITSHLWLLVFLSSLAAVLGLLISRSQTPVYQATTTLLVRQFMQSSNVNRIDIQTSTDVAKTYADIALRQPILSEVVETLKLDQTWQELKKQVKVKAIEGTQLLEVTAEANSPATARAIADNVASQLFAISPTMSEIDDTDTNYRFMRQQ